MALIECFLWTAGTVHFYSYSQDIPLHMGISLLYHILTQY
jgi:hypothetical protein